MVEITRHDAWSAGDAYDRYMGRWSRQIAPQFLDWLAVPPEKEWLEVGCGTGALSTAIVARCSPKRLLAIDPSAGFIETARAKVEDSAVDFRTGDAQAIPAEDYSADVIASGLVLNFVPDRERALAEMQRVARSGALIGFYVWDYPGGGIEFMRAFWTAATALDSSAMEFTEGKRFPFCNPEDLAALARDAGLKALEQRAIEVPTVFRDFDDFWQPFTLGAGPAPGYCTSLDARARERLRQKLSHDLPRQHDGSILMKARAWALKAVAS